MIGMDGLEEELRDEGIDFIGGTVSPFYFSSLAERSR